MSIVIRIPDYILLEDEYVLVLNKPNGLMVEPDRNGHPNLLQLVKQYLEKSVIPGEEAYAQHIHRLDRPVSGIILFAKQKSVLKNLSEQFAERKVKKYYQALTVAAPLDLVGVIEHWHRKEKKKAMLHADEFPYAEKAKLSYVAKVTDEQTCLWNIELHTGKYHQIRAQLASLDCPIIGDVLYGSTIAYKPNAIALHASKLIFHHPVSEMEIAIECEWPQV
ncbi:MAG: rluC [Chitinophagaceae bacterium]|nr:rluC [Chitinophagaceae bacterium]